MRILRGKSNLEVSSQGFALFVVGLVLATFLGGAIRTILSSDRVHERIIHELHAQFPKNEITVGRTEILLSRGFWPSIGLRALDVSFRQETCGKLSFTVTAPEAVVPIDLWSLRRARPRVGRAEINGARLRLDYHDCLTVAGEAPSSAQGLRATVKARGIQPPRMPWAELSDRISGLELNDFEITYERNLTWKIFFKHARIDLSDKMYFEAQADVQKNLTNGALHHAVRLTATGESDRLEWRSRTFFKEGEIEFDGKWNLNENTAVTQASLKQLPLKDVSSELFQMGLISRDIRLRAAWLTCGLEWDGSVAHFDQAPVKMRGCKLEGAYGHVDLAEGEAYFSEPQTFRRPAKFLLQNVQVQPLVEALGRQVFPAVLARLGVWTGTLDYGGPSSWRMEGELNNLEVVFSNLSLRGKQILSHVHLVANQSVEALGVHVDRAQINEGKFEGLLTFHLAPNGEGEWRADVKDLTFSPAIQNLLMGGHMSPLEAHVAGRMSAGDVTELNANGRIEELRGEGWRGEQLELNASLNQGAVKVDAKVLRAEAETGWKLYPQLRNTGRAAGDALAWRDLTLHLDLAKSGGTITNLSGTEVSKPTLWRAKGSWVRDAQFAGSLLVGNGMKAQTFVLRGEKGSLVVQDRLGDE